MKRIANIILALGLIMMISSSCSCNDEQDDKTDDNGIICFNTSNIVNNDFGGLGVEWGTYEDTKKIVPDAWTRITNAVDYLKPSIVRCMFNLDWICYDLDKKGTTDKNDDTWKYDFTSVHMEDCCDVLEYCQNNDIIVAFGFWNVIGNADTSVDTWGMIQDCSSDIRWAKMTADVLDYLVNIKGFTCIKYFVNTNEPNYTGNVGSSKMAYNTYAKWEQGVRQVRTKIDSIGLNNIDIVGGDTTGFGKVALDYLKNISINLKSILNNYGCHFYISNIDISKRNFYSYLSQLYKGIKENDKNVVNKKFYIWEAGLYDGKDAATDCNLYIQNYNYGYRMADYTLQAIQAGLDGVCYWDLDDGMHYMYNATGTTPKEWGMFSTYTGATIKDQEYRPWYYSSVMLTNILKRHNTMYFDSKHTTLTCIGTTTQDKSNGAIVIVNHNQSKITAKVCLQETVTNNEKTYVYIYKEGELLLDTNGKILPNYEYNTSINSIYELEIPTGAVVILSSNKIGE